MRAGKVIQIRVNPTDCQSVLDLMGLLNIDPYDGRSFAQCVSLALSSMLGSYRQGKVLPEVDTFQFLNRMGPFLNSGNDKKKYSMANALYKNGGRSIGTVELPKQEVHHPGQYIPQHLKDGDFVPVHAPFDRVAGMAEYESLKPIADEHMSAGNVDTPEVARFLELQDKLF